MDEQLKMDTNDETPAEDDDGSSDSGDKEVNANIIKPNGEVYHKGEGGFNRAS